MSPLLKPTLWKCSYYPVFLSSTWADLWIGAFVGLQNCILYCHPFRRKAPPAPCTSLFFNAKEDKTPNTLCFPDMEMVLGYCHGLDTGPPGICTVAEPTSGPLSKSRASMTVDVLRLLNTLTVCSNLRLIKGALIYP